ncbi:MAG: hypothetical protein HA495_05820 [Thaumarchaeota archaeon]|nr:hypothetical protein [Nitrososphaerota archaeon]
MENKPVAVLFKGRKALIMTDRDQEKAKGYVSSKLNFDPFRIRAATDRLSIAKELGILSMYLHMDESLLPRLDILPR